MAIENPALIKYFQMTQTLHHIFFTDNPWLQNRAFNLAWKKKTVLVVTARDSSKHITNSVETTVNTAEMAIFAIKQFWSKSLQHIQ